jgi:GGDEF domain-containing protein
MSDELNVGTDDTKPSGIGDIQGCLQIIVGLLKQRVDMDLWMFTTVIKNDWIVLAVSENSYGVKNGDVLPWNESVCSRMVQSNGPNIVPKLIDNAEYHQAPIVSKLPICAYLGYPLRDENNEILGTLCSIDQKEKDQAIETHSEEIRDLLQLGNMLINQYDTINRQSNALDVLNAQSDIDTVTGLPNQEAFFEIAIKRKAEYDKLACPLGIIVVEIGGLSLQHDVTKHSAEFLQYEDVVRAIANELSQLIRETDTIAKLDGSKFGMLFVNVGNRFVSAMVVKISNALAKYKLKVSIGADICREGDSVSQSIESANSNKLI